jgi:hypothetical protein
MSDTIKEEQPIAGQDHAEGSEDSSSAVRRRSSFEGRESKRQRQSPPLSANIATFPVAATTTTTTTSPRNLFLSTISLQLAHLLLLNRHTVFPQEVLPTRTSPWLTSNLNLKAPRVSHPHLYPSS